MNIKKFILSSMMLVAFSKVFGDEINDEQPVAIEFLDQEDGQPTELDMPATEADEEMIPEQTIANPSNYAEMLEEQTNTPTDELTENMLNQESAQLLPDEAIESVLANEQATEPVKPATLVVSAQLSKIRSEMENMKSTLSTSMATIESTLRSIEEMLQSPS